jgi:hypothetical protein
MKSQHAAPSAARLNAAYAAFALAFSCKQHNVVVPAVSSVLLIASALRRGSGLKAIVIAHLVGLVTALAYLGAEEIVTGGGMSQCVFVLPGGPFRTTNLGSWTHVAATFAVVAKKLFGYVLLGMACWWCARPHNGARLDSQLFVYLAAELAALVPLFYYNRGAADNYAFQAVVFASVLLGRCLARILGDPEVGTWSLICLAAASIILAARDIQFVELQWRARSENRAFLDAMLKSPPVSRSRPEEIYFVDRPQYNRLYGNRQLIHDEWVYGAFEAAGAASPRSHWLKSALACGVVRVVVLPDSQEVVAGVPGSLPVLGYRPSGRFGSYRVWERPS